MYQGSGIPLHEHRDSYAIGMRLAEIDIECGNYPANHITEERRGSALDSDTSSQTMGRISNTGGYSTDSVPTLNRLV